MSSEKIVIDVRNLSKRYEIYNTPRRVTAPCDRSRRKNGYPLQ